MGLMNAPGSLGCEDETFSVLHVVVPRAMDTVPSGLQNLCGALQWRDKVQSPGWGPAECGDVVVSVE